MSPALARRRAQDHDELAPAAADRFLLYLVASSALFSSANTQQLATLPEGPRICAKWA